MKKKSNSIQKSFNKIVTKQSDYQHKCFQLIGKSLSYAHNIVVTTPEDLYKQGYILGSVGVDAIPSLKIIALINKTEVVDLKMISIYVDYNTELQEFENKLIELPLTMEDLKDVLDLKSIFTLVKEFGRTGETKK
jgi:hypothetical protein